MRRLIDRFYVVDFPLFKRVFIAAFWQQQVGDNTVEVYVRGSLRIFADLPKHPKGQEGHDFSILKLFQGEPL